MDRLKEVIEGLIRDSEVEREEVGNGFNNFYGQGFFDGEISAYQEVIRRIEERDGSQAEAFQAAAETLRAWADEINTKRRRKNL